MVQKDVLKSTIISHLLSLKNIENKTNWHAFSVYIFETITFS